MNAQDFRGNQEIKDIEKTGQLVSIRLVPGDKNIKVFVVGYERLNLTFDDLGLEASTSIAGKTSKLRVSKQNDHFNIQRTNSNKLKLDLQFKADEKTDRLQVDVP